MSNTVDSIFDVAFWFADRALTDNEYLHPLKLQYLLYLSQSYYAIAYDGRKLFPAIFVAEERGPIEPSLYRAWTKGRPNFDGVKKLKDDVKVFSDSIWRRFGHHSAEHLAKLCRRTPAYQDAFKFGDRAEIILEKVTNDMILGRDLPDLEQVVKPKLIRSSTTGRSVEVKPWSPRQLDNKNKSYD
jgi:uncharacterized phage-associated protein